MLIARAVDVARTDTEVGIEYEIEGSSLAEGANHWLRVHDGSLRGNPEAGEYVTRMGLKVADVPDALASLKRAFTDSHSTLIPSSRCGVHVHLNAGDLTVEEMTVWALIYYLFEPALLAISGENRDHNLFCLSAQHAQESLDLIHRMRYSGSWMPINPDRYKYAALNLGALTRHGTLEFRSMLSTADPQDIAWWVDILLSIKNYAIDIKDPSLVIRNASGRGSWSVVTSVFNEGQIDRLGITKENADDLIIPQIRLIQAAAFCPWGEESIDRKKSLIIRNRQREQGGMSFWRSRFPSEFNIQPRPEEQPRPPGWVDEFRAAPLHNPMPPIQVGELEQPYHFDDEDEEEF